MLEDMAKELEELEEEERSAKIYFDTEQNIDDGNDSDSDDDSMPGLEQRNTNNDGDDSSDSEDEDDDDGDAKVGSPPEVKRKLRSGKAFWQKGVKMQPTDRVNNERLKFSAYHDGDGKRKKLNAKNKRTELRRKKQIKHLRKRLQRELALQQHERKTGQASRNHLRQVEKEMKHNLIFQQSCDNNRREFYAPDHSLMIARVIQQTRDRVQAPNGVSFIQQYYITKGLKIFGEDGKGAAMKELTQLVQRNCWELKLVSELTENERKKAVEAMMLLAEKNNGTIKGRYVFKGSKTRGWLSREETSSPTASQEAITITCVIDAHEGRDVMTVDIPNAFIQTKIPEVKKGQDRVTMKITGILIDYLLERIPEYRQYIVYEGKRQVIYVIVLRAIYGQLEAS